MHLNPHAKCRSSRFNLKLFKKKKNEGHLNSGNTLKVADSVISLSRFKLGRDNLFRGGNCEFYNLSKGIVYWQIEQYHADLMQPREINHHWSLDINHLEHCNTEQKSTAKWNHYQ